MAELLHFSVNCGFDIFVLGITGKGLSMTDKQISPLLGHVIKALRKGISGGCVKIYHNIPTAYKVKGLFVFYVVHKVEFLEYDLVAYPVCHLIHALFHTHKVAPV